MGRCRRRLGFLGGVSGTLCGRRIFVFAAGIIHTTALKSHSFLGTSATCRAEETLLKHLERNPHGRLAVKGIDRAKAGTQRLGFQDVTRCCGFSVIDAPR